MPDKLLNETLKILRNSIDEYFEYIDSYEIPSKSVMNYLVCESLRRCLGETYLVHTGKKEKVDAYNRYVDVLIQDRSGKELGFLIINMKNNVDNEKENHKLKSFTEKNKDAFGLLISLSKPSDKEILYKKYFGGNCITQGVDVISS